MVALIPVGSKPGTVVISQVRFTNLNYVKVWIYQVSPVVVRGCVFDALGGSASVNDNIGGGRFDGLILDSNIIDATATGNAVDLVRATHVAITNNVINGTPSSPQPIQLEGIKEATIIGNTIWYAGISIQSESRYHHRAGVAPPARGHRQ